MRISIRISKPRAKCFLVVLALKMVATILALYVYSRLTNVADASGYTTGQLSGSDWMNRTLLVGNIAFPLAQLVGQRGVFFVFSFVSAIGIWLLLMEFPDRFRWRIAPLFFLPTVAMWTSIVSKETLASFFLCLIFWWWLRWIRGSSTWKTWVAVTVGFFFYFILRPQYAVPVAYLCTVTVLLTPNRATMHGCLSFFPPSNLSRFSNGVLAVLLLAFVLISLPRLESGMNDIVEKAIGYFPNNGSRANRHQWLGWTCAADFWNNAWWALPFSIIGPLPREVVARPIFIVNFIEGLFLFFSPIVLIILAYRSLRDMHHLRRILLFGIVPTLLMLILVHAPFGTPNPGSAVRYRAGFEYILTLPTVFILLIARALAVGRKPPKDGHGLALVKKQVVRTVKLLAPLFAYSRSSEKPCN